MPSEVHFDLKPRLAIADAAANAVDSAKERLRAFSEQEKKYPRLEFSANTFTLGKCRAKLIDWFIRIKQVTKFSPNFVPLATSIFDRVINLEPNDLSYRKLNLIASVCVYLASKTGEQFSLSPDSIVDLSRGTLNRRDLIDFEWHTLNLLDWRVNPPTLPAYFQEYFELTQANPECRELMTAKLEPLVERLLKKRVIQFSPQPELSFAMFESVMDELMSVRPDLVTPAAKAKLESGVQETLGFHTTSAKVQSSRQAVEHYRNFPY